MRTLALAALLALPLAAQTSKITQVDPGVVTTSCENVVGGCPRPQTTLTPEEHDSYVLMVIQDLVFQNTLLENLRTHKAGNDDLENRDRAHQERMNALKQLATKHNACEGGDWNIAKKEWACPTKQ